MVGGTIFHRDVIQREISRALVLNLSGTTRCSGTAEEIFVLDNAFALIEGQPPRHLLAGPESAETGCMIRPEAKMSVPSVTATLGRIRCKCLKIFGVPDGI